MTDIDRYLVEFPILVDRLHLIVHSSDKVGLQKAFLDATKMFEEIAILSLKKADCATLLPVGPSVEKYVQILNKLSEDRTNLRTELSIYQ